MDLNTKTQKTWCPGCGNFLIEKALTEALKELMRDGFRLENFVIVSGIGCHGKIVDYLNLNSFYSLHGRAIPVAEGIKIANPDLFPIVCVGDGDAYSEGLEHLIFTAKRNADITVLVHDNRVFSLTTGQFTPTSPYHFPGRSTPKGSPEKPLNPIELMISLRASFVARGYAARGDHLKSLIKKAVLHKGFSFIDVLQPCVAYFNSYEIYNQAVYELEKEKHDFHNLEKAFKKAQEWDYNKEGKIPIGVFYQRADVTFREELLRTSS